MGWSRIVGLPAISSEAYRLTCLAGDGRWDGAIPSLRILELFNQRHYAKAALKAAPAGPSLPSSLGLSFPPIAFFLCLYWVLASKPGRLRGSISPQ